MSKEKLKNRILSQINHEQPYPAWRFWLTDFLRILTILILLLGAGLSLAYFIWDSLEIDHLTGSSLDNSPNFWMMLGRGLPEILILVIFLSILLYMLYRQTDLPFVKNRSLVLGSVWVILVVVSTATIVFVQNSEQFEQYFMETQNTLESLPYRPNRFKNIYKETRIRNIFVGRVVQINKDSQNIENGDLNSIIIVENPFESKIFIVPNTLIQTIKPGDLVKITLSVSENTAQDMGQDAQNNITNTPDMDTIIEIQKLPKKPFDPLRSPIVPPLLLPNPESVSLSVRLYVTFFSYIV